MRNNSTFSSSEEQNKFIDKHVSNIKSDLIEITHDKLENILLKHLEKLDIRKSWITPTSILLTVLVTWLTATFNDFLGISKSVWEALFLILLIGSTVWLLYSIINIVIYWDQSSIKSLITTIKSLENSPKTDLD
jgi:hypothetical protein